MKRLYIVTALVFVVQFAFGQRVPFEVKVKSTSQQPVRGLLKVVNAEGIGVAGNDGTYYIFRPTDVVKINVKRMDQATIAQHAGRGALYGLGAGIDITVGNPGANRAAVANTVFATGAGVITGIAVMGVSRLFNTKAVYRIANDKQKFQQHYAALSQYVIAD